VSCFQDACVPFRRIATLWIGEGSVAWVLFRYTFKRALAGRWSYANRERIGSRRRMLEGDSDVEWCVLRWPFNAIVAVNPDLEKICQAPSPERL
jgi:hypothetical protein